MTARAAAWTAIVLILVTACSDGSSQTGRQELAQRSPRAPLPSASSPADPGEAVASAAPGRATSMAGVSSRNPAATGLPPGPAPTRSAARLSTYRAEDFYRWHWSPTSRGSISWGFTEDIPSGWRPAIQQASSAWNEERRSLQYSVPLGVMPFLPAPGLHHLAASEQRRPPRLTRWA